MFGYRFQVSEDTDATLDDLSDCSSDSMEVCCDDLGESAAFGNSYLGIFGSLKVMRQRQSVIRICVVSENFTDFLFSLLLKGKMNPLKKEYFSPQIQVMCLLGLSVLILHIVLLLQFFTQFKNSKGNFEYIR